MPSAKIDSLLVDFGWFLNYISKALTFSPYG